MDESHTNPPYGKSSSLMTPVYDLRKKICEKTSSDNVMPGEIT